MNRIPLDDYPEASYKDLRDLHNEYFYRFLSEGCSVLQSVNGYYYHGIDCYMDENGMDKFVAMLAGMLFMIENDEVNPVHARATLIDIQDFESGNYDDLFTEKDLDDIKADISKIKNYLSEHAGIANNYRE